MNDYTILEMITAQLQDCESMAALNDKIYPKEWHVSPELLRNLLKKNPDIYRILKTTEGVKGMYSLFPLAKEAYKAILKGSLSEYELEDKLLTYDRPEDVYLYFITLIVDTLDSRRKEYASKVIKDIPGELIRLKQKGVHVQEIGGFAVSPEGARVLPRMGFTHHGETVIQNGHEYPVFRAKPVEVIHSIK
ncbi:hypothetical protein R4Z09_26640 [Niallia oryzisoli]|uniref:Uncharacterized protein n=1 Tax=Niallia oryzisoli TaxID=1737571 RepID=A0ABZ2CBT7_9BACI